MSKQTVLYVDDEPENLIVFEAGVEERFNVLLAPSGAEALEILQRQPIPVVVADQRMPNMSGAELFEIMRREYPLTKRIMLTGHTDPAEILDAINNGQIYYFLQKPWNETLIPVLIRAFETYELERANQTLADRVMTSERFALLGQSTARIAHEMGNQLCMLPLLELLEQKYAEEPDLAKIAHFTRETHERLVELIDDVKNLVRFDQQDFSRQLLRMSSVIQELVSSLRFNHTIAHKRLSFHIRSDSYVVGNKVKLQQAMLNLVKNATDAIRTREDGFIRIDLDRENEQCVVRVTDNGSGITPEHLEQIWVPHFTTKGECGTGLGLDITRATVEALEGSITCDSRPGEETIFEIRLPCQPLPEVEDGFHSPLTMS